MLTPPRTAMRTAGLIAASALLIGCSAPNGTLPSLTLDGVYLGSAAADIDVTISNPGRRTFQLQAIDYTLTVGPLPVADGEFVAGTEIPSQGQVSLTFTAPLSQPPMDPSAEEAQLTGAMRFEGGGQQTPSSAPFSAETTRIRR